MKVTALLGEEHRAFDRLLARVARNAEGHGVRARLWRELVDRLMTHLAVERSFFLDAAAVRGVDVECGRATQACVRNAILQAAFAEDDEEKFPARIRDLHAAFNEHAEALDDKLAPVVEATVAGAVLETLGNQMRASGKHADRRGPSESGPRELRYDVRPDVGSGELTATHESAAE